MVFTILNSLLSLFLILETYYVDRVENKFDDGTNPVITNVLMLSVVSGLYTIFSTTSGYVTPALFTLFMRVCFIIEGCMLVNIAFCFPYYAWKYTSGIIVFLKIVLYIVVAWFVFFLFKEIKVSSLRGIEVKSSYLFSGDARYYFPWTWYTVYVAFFRFLLPFTCCLMMLGRNEQKANKLDRYKGYIYTTGLCCSWLLYIGLYFVADVFPGYSLLHYHTYLPILIILPLASWITTAPSVRRRIELLLKAIFLFIIPAVFLGFAFMVVSQLYHEYGVIVAFFGVAAALLVIFLASIGYRPFLSNRVVRSSDYAKNFEKDLAEIDYSGEMDEIADKMFQIFADNAEAVSMAVYINSGNASFENAYTSNGKRFKIDEFELLFESLLNNGQNVIISYQLETEHSLSNYKDQLTKFFKKTESDALFILNEGRSVHGIIILGPKDGNDHYKEYDLNVFTKLYSYFFVFGYYMRNISNKEIIGTVNRELRMSSQIITSIQENMDVPNTPKIDSGCIMVPAHNIGGEFVDMIRLTDTRHLYVMGDLSGKGIAASMSMVILKQIIRAYLAEIHDFKQLVVKINRFIRYNLQKGTIFAGMFAIVNFENDTMYYINCGIPAMLLYTEAYNNVIEIQGGGHILGFVDDISSYISVKQIKLHKNDIVLACTDGLIESHSLRGEAFGKDRIQRNMVANAMYPAQRMAQFEYDDLMRFMSHEMEDDVSVLVLKYLQTNESELEDAKAIKAEFMAHMEKFEESATDIEEVVDSEVPVEPAIDELPDFPE